MRFIVSLFTELFEMLFSFCELFVAFIGDLLQMIVSLTKLPEILLVVLEWTTAFNISAYVYLIITIAVVYKILGREG